ncbi:TA system VapC family ribonuclease toxin [Microlunatus elymi]|uniref:TA system VapC family ribonuclease toxin n=1 Tax=Microlunatus elymi TaxID=2596828 RepID=UPI00143DB65E|nr:TA system VapC family ribonuclease toxin [Microlunatus elymi]
MSSYVPDTNVWLALTVAVHGKHLACRDWIQSIGDTDSIAFCRATRQSLLRLLTTAAVLKPYDLPPLSNEQAWATYDLFTSDSRISLAEEPAEIDQDWRIRSSRPDPSPKLWMDSYLAAFAKATAATFVTTDQAFRQWADLEVAIID